MSRHWTEYQYVDAQGLWEFIDDYLSRLSLLSTEDTVESSELCKLLILGRREALHALMDYLHENEISLQTIIAKRHGILSEEDLEALLKKDGVR